ncbi:ARM repeat-containing protein [Violaceomyces palustris]|uniref:ARM repeat-containing protein n=1 Tax=Violaceomyces palustris TaxID=1673888 RepID=A0ACD0P583_9BASI|nr:ARM repeat-containing protein [Violaceomyces palustris]
MDPSFVQGLHQLLQQSNVPDTNAVKSATDALQNTYYKNPNCVPALFEILATSSDLAVRQLAAVELRKRLAKSGGKVWAKQSVQVRDGIKAKLLQIISSEQSALVRNGIARVISEIARKELPAGTWPDLLPFLFQAAESQTAAVRQIAIFVFYTILETFVDGENLEQYLPQIMQLFAKSLQDPESIEVRITTVRALGKVAQNLEADASADMAAMQSAVPQMVGVLNQCLEQSHNEGVRQILDVLEEICMLEVPIISNHIAELIDFFLANGANKEHEEDLRLMCLNSLIWTCSYKRSKVQSLGLAKPMIARLMPIAVEEDSEDADEDSPSRLALRVIDGLATELPPSHVFPPLLEQMQAYMSNPDPHHRKAAMMAFGVSVEGCSEYIRPHMNDLWPFVEAGLRDPEVVVRKAACIALGCLCEMLEEECASKHATLLPIIMELVNNPDTQRSACTALDSLLEVMGDDISQYLPAIMERLAGLLETAPIPVKATVTGAIGSAAHASKEGFLPYFNQTMQRIQPFLLLKEEGDEMDLRGITTDTVGTFAEAVGKEAFRPYFNDLMKLAFEGMSLQSPRLRECSFIFFAVMSRVFGEEFNPFLPHVVPKLIESCQQSEHDPVPGAPGDGTVNGIGIPGSSSGAFAEDDDDEYVDIDELNEQFLNVNSAVAIEKEVAADSLGEIFTHTKAGFLPYIQQSVEELVNLLEHFYQGIRKSAVSSLFAFINTLNEMSNPEPWQPGAQVKVPLNAEVQKLVNAVIPAVMEMWESEDDRTAAIEICQSLAECLNKNGPAIIAPQYLDVVCTYTIMILEKRSPPQLDSETPEDENEEASEYESVLISAASDLVGAMANVLGPDFTDPLKQFMPQLMKYYSPGRSMSDRATAVGSLGEIITGMKGAITPFTQDILSLLSRGLSDEEASVRSNAVFASGVLIEHTEADLSAHFGALLNAIMPFFEKKADETDEIKTARDNACGCLSRMIIKKADALPLEQALPILFSSLPLEKDMVEWSPVLHCLMGLIQANNQVATQHIDTILQLFAHVLGTNEETLGGLLRGQCVGFISQLNSQIPDKVSAAGLQQYLV